MKKFFSLLTVLSLTLLLSACGKSDTVRIGILGPLTGQHSYYGLSVEEGAQLAADEINAAGGVLGKDIELIAYDTKGESTEGINAYNRLVDSDEIHALIGPTFSGVANAIKLLAVSDNVPMLSPSATHADVTLNAPNIFRACFTDSYQGKTIADFAADSLELENVAVFYNRDDAYSEGLADAFMAEYDSKSLSYTAFEFSDSDVDFNATLSNIKAGGFDAVFLPAYVAQVGAILTQADSLGLEIPFLGGDGWDGVEAEYASVVEGNYFGSHYAKTDTSSVVQDFVTNFENENKESPNVFNALAYDAVYAMVAAIEEAGSLDADLIVAALADLEFVTGVTGSIAFDVDGDPIKPITIIQVVNGQHVVIEKVGAVVDE